VSAEAKRDELRRRRLGPHSGDTEGLSGEALETEMRNGSEGSEILALVFDSSMQV